MQYEIGSTHNANDHQTELPTKCPPHGLDQRAAKLLPGASESADPASPQRRKERDDERARQCALGLQGCDGATNALKPPWSREDAKRAVCEIKRAMTVARWPTLTFPEIIAKS